MTSSMRRGPLAHGWGWLQNLPGCCATCNDWGAQRICTACTSRFARLAPRCRLCAARVVEPVGICGACLQSPPALDGAWAAVDYAFPWTQLVGQFKFRQGLDLATSLTELMARNGPPADAAPRLILPVPLSASRMRSRVGYKCASRARGWWELEGWGALRYRSRAARIRARSSPRASRSRGWHRPAR
jgi:predicted amidophosphoribosyltransferase